ncbi:bacitracin ABC transporter ATP-binding protein [Paenibacillus sp. FSL R7-0273]|uniref:ABC transporter ATP-binding protein n=1 Tax=Paenibacillus sp. FSL R7-0273 TaxID=1536772 RepID=UPI0004F86D2F|nr:ABC transporter ATP-binding protein [Paenibacillus sp. FSL R7-0273]AIQ45286.1 bacitracin ABC transporter ATP-binding protein [Paenibacillus sp. FSL R7-0273]OMF88906.1 bacitracin ABC transporter ATP-binding protein [Paenibacillus sp. FSL R7-0273]
MPVTAESANKPVASLMGVSKKIGSKTLVSDLTLDIPPGQIFGFLGPNGAGKTTTIRMMVGLISISQGDILICGRSIKDHFEEAVANIGAIVENPEMYKFLSGYQNLRQYARMVPGVTKQRIDEVVELVGLGQRINDKVKTYSLGMRQRLGVAQALLHRPKLLILDEPTNGLDPQGIRELRDYLRRLCQTEGTTVFVSSHLLSEMELMCDSVAIIQNGRLIDVKQLKAVGDAVLPVTETLFEVNDPEGALALLGQGVLKNGGISLIAGREEIAELNAALVAAGFKIYSIRALSRSLEDQFLEITGGEGIG